MDPRLARERMRGAVDEVELDSAVYRGEEGAVEPAAALRDKFWDLWGVENGGTGTRVEKAKNQSNFVRL